MIAFTRTTAVVLKAVLKFTVALDPAGAIEAPPVTDQEYEVALATADAVYTTALFDLQTEAGPVITGADGREVTVKQRAGPVPHELLALTQIGAELDTNAGVKSTTIDNPLGAVETIVTPAGTDHVYDVAPATAAIE